MPLGLLTDCEGRKPEPAQLESDGDKAVVAQWRDESVPQIVGHDVPEKPKLAELAKRPPGWPTTGPGSWMPWPCITRPSRRTLIRSGSRQATSSFGATTAFGCREFAQDQPVQVGRSDDWTMFVVTAWAIHCRSTRRVGLPGSAIRFTKWRVSGVHSVI